MDPLTCPFLPGLERRPVPCPLLHGADHVLPEGDRRLQPFHLPEHPVQPREFLVQASRLGVVRQEITESGGLLGPQLTFDLAVDQLDDPLVLHASTPFPARISDSRRRAVKSRDLTVFSGTSITFAISRCDMSPQYLSTMTVR